MTTHQLNVPMEVMENDLDNKGNSEKLETVPTDVSLLKSRFDELSIWRTLWVFRRAALCCVAVYTGYLCEGFEVSAIGAAPLE